MCFGTQPLFWGCPPPLNPSANKDFTVFIWMLSSKREKMRQQLVGTVKGDRISVMWRVLLKAWRLIFGSPGILAVGLRKAYCHISLVPAFCDDRLGQCPTWCHCWKERKVQFNAEHLNYLYVQIELLKCLKFYNILWEQNSLPSSSAWSSYYITHSHEWFKEVKGIK